MAKTTAPEVTGTDLLIINPTELTVDMPKLITEYDAFLAKAEAAFKTLPKIVDDETKEIHFEFKKRCALRMQEFNDMRMPFTRKLNNIVSEFTTREKSWKRLMDLTDDNTNKWAEAELRRTREAQAKQDAELKAAQAKIQLEGRIREYGRQRLVAMLDKVRTGAGGLVQKVTKENFETTKKRLQTEPKWTAEMEEFLFEIPASWIKDEKHFKEILAAELPEIKAEYLEKSADILKQSLTILDTALTNKEEATRLQEAEAERQKEADAQKDLELQRELDAQKAIALIDQERIEPPKVRVKMKMEILDNDAWPQIFMFWYTNDPEAKTKDLIKKTFLQLKTYCEKRMSEDGLMLEHESIEWHEDVKAR